jgi:hypothetical protein
LNISPNVGPIKIFEMRGGMQHAWRRNKFISKFWSEKLEARDR